MVNAIKSWNTIPIPTEYGTIVSLMEAEEMWSLLLLCDN